MANSKISALTAAATVVGTEVLPIVQSSATVKATVANLTPGLSTITAAKGGTGQTTYTIGDTLYASSTSALSKLGIGTADYVLTSSGSAPQWSASLKAVAGGTGQTSYAVGDILYASTTTALSKLADVATGNALISGGVGVAPSWGKIGLTTHISGTLAVGNGGLGITTTPANGQIPIGNGTNYVAATITGGGGITVTNGSGSISLANNNSPAFLAFATSSQSITTNTFTKVTFSSTEFNVGTGYASSTFTPNVAGYYQINATIRMSGTLITDSILSVYKNGAEFKRVTQISPQQNNITLVGSMLVYCNGTTDYIEIYGLITATSPQYNYVNNAVTSFFSGALVRGA
jgi:hypothetical protein